MLFKILKEILFLLQIKFLEDILLSISLCIK